MTPVSLGDIAGVIAALAFAYLVLRLGSVVGKAGKVLDEARIGVRGVSEQTVPLLSQVTDTVAATNEQMVRVDTITANVSSMTTNVNALTVAVRRHAGLPGGQGRGLHLRRAVGPQRRRHLLAVHPRPSAQGLIGMRRSSGWPSAPPPGVLRSARSPRPPRPTRPPTWPAGSPAGCPTSARACASWPTPSARA